MKSFLQRFTLFSASGFILSLVVHILGLFNRVPFFGWFAMLLHFGIFVAILGAVIAFLRLRRSEGKGFWKRTLQASPVWMRWGLVLIFIYALGNFFIFWNELFNLHGKSPDEIMAIVVRGFSGHWLFLYFGTFLVFYAAKQATEQNAFHKNTSIDHGISQ